MDENFKKALSFVLEREGGYSNDPQDPGGETKFGISKRAYPQEDIKNLTEQRAAQLYFQDYWLNVKCHLLPFPIALALFDGAVNQGQPAAVMCLQEALGLPTSEVDGVIGPKTIRAVTDAPTGLLERFLAKRAVRYSKASAFPRYAFGWMRRLMECHRLALGVE